MNRFVKAFLVVLLTTGLVYAAGQWSPNGFGYKPQISTQGTTDQTNFSMAMDRIDAQLAAVFGAWNGNPSTQLQNGVTATPSVLGNYWAGMTGRAFVWGSNIYSSNLQTILTTLGTSTPYHLVLGPGTYNITTTNTVIPANIALEVKKGAVMAVATGVTLTIQGPIDAGPYQIFSWTGTGKVDVSASPTTTIPPEWFGAVAESGPFTYDNEPALAMLVSATGQHQTIFCSKGWYQIETPWVITRSISIKGSGMFQSGFWINLTGGTGTGVTFGVDSTATDAMILNDFGFIGPASCCTYGVDFLVTNPHTNRVNFFMGSSQYACRTRSCEVYGMGMYSYSNNNQPTATACPAGAFTADQDPITAWANNTFDLDIQTLGNNTITAVYLNNASTNINLTGTIQASSSAASPFVINSSTSQLTIGNLYTEGFTGDSFINGCKAVHINNIEYFLNNSTLRLVNCDGVSLIGGFVWNLNVNAGCRGVTSENTQINNLVNNSPDMQFIGRMPRISTTDYKAGQAPDKINVMYNSAFGRWQSGGPDGWGTVYNCTAAKEASTIHLAKASCKLVTTGANAFIEADLDATQIQRLLGKFVTFSSVFNVTSAANLATYPVNINIQVTVPDWTTGLSPKIGDAVKATGSRYAGVLFVCTDNSNGVGQTGATEPVWNSPTENTTFTDGGVTWCTKPATTTDAADPGLNSSYTSAMAGTWHKVALNYVIPGNATAVATRVNLLQQTNGSQTTAYVAEPTLMASNQTPTALVESAGEFQNYIQIGGHKIGFDAVIPTSGSSIYAGQYASVGDVVFNTAVTSTSTPAWFCTGAGINGSTSTWTLEPVL